MNVIPGFMPGIHFAASEIRRQNAERSYFLSVL